MPSYNLFLNYLVFEIKLGYALHCRRNGATNVVLNLVIWSIYFLSQTRVSITLANWFTEKQVIRSIESKILEWNDHFSNDLMKTIGIDVNTRIVIAHSQHTQHCQITTIDSVIYVMNNLLINMD